MTPGARIQAAIEILEDLAARPRPADKALREWGTAHRFAGSKDRAAIRSHVFAAFRRRGEATQILGAEDARSLVLGSTLIALGWSATEIAATVGTGKHDARAITADERAKLDAAKARGKPAGGANWPEWLRAKMLETHGERAEALMAALIETAPLDLRVNIEQSEPGAVIEALKSVGFPAEATRYSPWGIRIARDEDLVGANVRTLPMFRSGTIEIQDEGSQLTALLSRVAPGEQILELCAGGAGKTLALAAMTAGKGQIYACDTDAARLKAGQERIARADLRNVQPRQIAPWDPQGRTEDPDLEALAGKLDLVFLDVPCSGSGAWRRQPDAKWRLTPETLRGYTQTQAAILRRGARLVKPGGRLVYVTCSLFTEENAEQIAAFLDRQSSLSSPVHGGEPAPDVIRGVAQATEAGTESARPHRPSGPLPPQAGEEIESGRAPAWQLADMAAYWQEAGEELPEGVRVDIPGAASGSALQLSPVTTHTDGFFIATLERIS